MVYRNRSPGRKRAQEETLPKGHFTRDVLFYSSSQEDPGEKWLKLFQDWAPENRIKIFHDLGKLSFHIRQSTEPLILILVIVECEEFRRIRAIQSLLHAIQLVLIVPDCEKETLGAAEELRPRFLTSGEINLSDLVEVIKKISSAPKSFKTKLGPVPNVFKETGTTLLNPGKSSGETSLRLRLNGVL